MAGPSRFDAAVRELSQAVPAEFVLVRARLEAELREAGDSEGAAALKRRRRPHLAAWACNQLTHRDPALLDELDAATVEVADAQRAALRGENAERLRAAGRIRQEVLDRAADAAQAALKGVTPDPTAYRDNIVATLDAATLDAEYTRDLHAGTIEKPLRAPAAFDLVGAVPDTARPAKSAARERQAAQREVERAREEVTEQSTAVDEMDAELASAEMHAHSATVHVGEIEQALVRAQESRRAADEAVRDARQGAEDAKKALRQAAERLRQAEARLRDLDRS